MKPLDDPQLRAKLIRASTDMPHVDVWAKIQAEAGDISQAAQARAPRPRFSIFSSLQVLAPAFVVLLVFGATLLSLTDEPVTPPRRTTTVAAVESVTAALPATVSVVAADEPLDHGSSPAYDRLMARYAERLEGISADVDDAASTELSITYAHDAQGHATTRVETRDDMRAEWREYATLQQPRARSNALRLIRPFLSSMTPQ